jgi:hypothetical protein
MEKAAIPHRSSSFVAVYRGWPLSGQVWGLAGHCRSPLLDVQQLARTGPKAGWRRATGSGLKRSNSGLLSPDGHPAQNQVSSRKCWFESDRGHHCTFEAQRFQRVRPPFVPPRNAGLACLGRYRQGLTSALHIIAARMRPSSVVRYGPEADPWRSLPASSVSGACLSS